jgi:hypothetical protein
MFESIPCICRRHGLQGLPDDALTGLARMRLSGPQGCLELAHIGPAGQMGARTQRYGATFVSQPAQMLKHAARGGHTDLQPPLQLELVTECF